MMSQIFTMEEAAARLRISRRALQEIVKIYPHYFLNGRRKLFTDADIEAIIKGLRPAPQPVHRWTVQKTSKQYNAEEQKREISDSQAELRRLLTRRTLKSSSK